MKNKKKIDFKDEIDKNFPIEKTIFEAQTGKVIQIGLPKKLTAAMGWHKDAQAKKKVLIVPLIQYNAILILNNNSKLSEDRFYANAAMEFYKNEPEKREYAIKKLLQPIDQLPYQDTLFMEHLHVLYKEGKGIKGFMKKLPRMGIKPEKWILKR